MTILDAPPKKTRTPPGPKGRLVLGHTFDYIRDPLGYLTRCAREHGDVVRLRLGDTTVFALFHPEYVDEILRAHGTRVIKDKMTRLISPIVGQGLLTSEGDFWRRQRKLTMPSFQHQAIERYGAVMVDHAVRMRDSWKVGEERDLHHDMMALTLGVVGKTLFDAEVTGESHEVGDALETVMDHFLSPWKWFPILERIPTKKNRAYKAAMRQIDEVVYTIIRRRRASGDDPGDLLSRFLAVQDDEGAGMTDAQLRDECVTIFLAGHETTALVLTYAFRLLALHPEAEAALGLELDQVLGGRRPTANDMARLKYTEWVVRESMRLYPPAWGIGREATEPIEIGGYLARIGTQFSITPWVMHRDPRWWDEPEAFRPERWDNDLAKRLPKGVYIPFGGGPRVCIGNHFAMMEAVLLLATLSQNHTLKLVPDQTLELAASITLRPRGGTRVIVERRGG